LSISGTYGGDTTCLEIQAKDSPLIIIDAGTGIRFLGYRNISQGSFKSICYIELSNLSIGR
jgi:hypothetical protein